MEREKLKDIVLIFLVVFFCIIIMNEVGDILESFIQSELLLNIILIVGCGVPFGFLLYKIMLLFKGEEYREFLRRTRKSQYCLFFIFLPLFILLWIIQQEIVDPLLGTLVLKIVGTIIFIGVLFLIAFVVNRKFKKEWKEFKQHTS